MKKYQNIIFPIIFFLILIIPFAFTNHHKNVISDIDNRSLVDAPKFSDPNFSTEMEQYLSDRIGFRSQMIQAYTQLHNDIFHEMVHPTYQYGKQNYVFFKMHKNYTYDSYRHSFVNAVIQMRDYCEARGIEFYFLFNPEKLSVYRRYLPDGYNYDDTWVQEMIQDLAESEVKCVDNSAYLTDLSYTEQVFNIQYDAGHWNDLGCFYGMNHLLERIHEDFPDVSPLTFDDFSISSSNKTSLLVSDFPIEENVPVFFPLASFQNKTSQVVDELALDPRYTAFHYFANDNVNSSDLPRTLIFQGSYLNGRTQFLYQNTSEEMGVHNYQNVLNLPYWVNLMQPDLVIFEVAEYVFSDQYFDSAKMDSLSFPPQLIEDSSLLEEQLTLIPIYPASVNASFHSTDEIDSLFISRSFPDAKNAYFITKDDVYDLSVSDDGNLSLTILHGFLSEDPDAWLVIENTSGEFYRINTPMKLLRELDLSLTLTPGVTISESGTITFNTNVDNNRFSYIALMIYDYSKQEYQVIETSASPNHVISGKLTNNSTSGEFDVILKANSNLSDESASFHLNLEQGETLYYQFKIDSFNAQNAAVSNYKTWR